jgi:hypothetical protein
VNIEDIQVQTFLLRILHSFFILALSIELYRSASYVDNQRLTKYFWKASLIVALFFAARIVAGVLDSYYTFTIGWFSNVVNICFWGYLVYKFRTVRLILASPKNSEVRVSLRDDVDEILNKLEAARNNVRKLSH